ncbi:MAG: CIA30 family protein [Bacteroidota bacterium]
MQKTTLFKFSTSSEISNWIVVDDVVMGGESYGKFHLNEEGNGVFSGSVSLENNGGFSSVRYRLNQTGIQNYAAIVLKIKGDGKRYQFRIKDKQSNYYSYVNYFKSSSHWETIKIPLSELYPTFRGRKVSIPNYDKNTIEEIGFLIGNKAAEEFQLEIDFVGLE